MTRLHLMRHAKARASPEQEAGELFTVGDDPLSELGQRQARRMGRLIANAAPPVDSVHASTAIRCRQTARIVADELDAEHDVREHEDLLEIPYAEPGASYEEILGEIVATAKRLREEDDPDLASGTTWNQATGRFSRALEAIVEEHEHPLVVAHGAQNRAWLTRLLDMPPHRLFFLEQDHACLNVVAYGGRHPVLQKLNVTADPLATQGASNAGE